MILPQMVRDWGLRALAALVFLSAAYLIFVLTNLPVATRVETAGAWKAMRGETLTVGLAREALGRGRPVLSLNGPPGRDVGVALDRARFGPETQRDLNARTAGVYVRADPEDKVILDGRDDRQRAKLIATRIKHWKAMRSV